MPDLQQHHDGMSSRSKWALIGFIAISAFFLLSEHRAHYLGILPYLLLLGCPLMHLFHGHGGHGGHGRSPTSDGESSATGESPASTPTNVQRKP